MVTDLLAVLAIALLVTLVILCIRFVVRSPGAHKNEAPPKEPDRPLPGVAAGPEKAPTSAPPSGGLPCPRCGRQEMQTGYMLKTWGTMAHQVILSKSDLNLFKTTNVLCDVCPHCGHISLRAELPL